MCFVGASLCHSSDNMRVISNVAEDITVGTLYRSLVRLFHWFVHFVPRIPLVAAVSSMQLAVPRVTAVWLQMMMMMRGFVERDINSPQTRCQSAKQVGLQMSSERQRYRELQFAERLVNCSRWLGQQPRNFSAVDVVDGRGSVEPIHSQLWMLSSSIQLSLLLASPPNDLDLWCDVTDQQLQASARLLAARIWV